MNKYVVTSLMVVLVNASSATAAGTSGDNKVERFGKAVGRGVMWGPKKIGQGMEKVGDKTKSMFHKNTKKKSAH